MKLKGNRNPSKDKIAIKTPRWVSEKKTFNKNRYEMRIFEQGFHQNREMEPGRGRFPKVERAFHASY